MELNKIVLSIFKQRKFLIKKGLSKLENDKEILLKMQDIRIDLLKYEHAAGWLHVVQNNYGFIVLIIPANDNFLIKFTELNKEIDSIKCKLSLINNKTEIYKIKHV